MYKVVLDVVQANIAIDTGIARAKLYKPQFDGVTTKKNYDQERHGGSFAEFATKQIDAVGAETAAAEYLGITDYEPQNGTYKDRADIGKNVEVKHTYRRNGNLIISSIDRDSDIAILVIGRMPVYVVIGWFEVQLAKQDKYRSELITGDSYLIPRADLHPMQHLAMIGEAVYGYHTV
jgi:hypothetical protein